MRELPPLLQQFVEESQELLDGINRLTLDLERNPQDGAALQALFRHIHTLKGNSGLFDLPQLTLVLHAAEDALTAVQQGTLAFSPPLADQLLQAIDYVDRYCRHLAEHALATPPPFAGQGGRLAQAIRTFLPPSPDAPAVGAPTASPAAQPPWRRLPDDLRLRLLQRLALQPDGGPPLVWVRYRPAPDAFYHGDDPLWTVRQIPQLLWGEVLEPSEGWPLPQEMDVYRSALTYQCLSSASLAALQEHFRYVSDQVELLPFTAADLIFLSGDGAPPLSPALRAKLAAALDGGDAASVAATAEDALAELPPASAAAQALSWLSHLARTAPAAVGLGARLLAPAASDPAPDDALVNANRDQPPAHPAAPAGEGRASALRIDPGKVDHLMNLIGELVVAKNALPFLAKRAIDAFGQPELGREIQAQYAVIHRLAEAMQDAVMQMRMLPVSVVFQRVPRLVRDLARRLNKRVQLTITGEDTELDKQVVEALGEPLVHLVRNSLDHGIELPAERRRQGKPEAGRLVLTARQEADHAVIEVVDDGRGIDPDAVAQKALSSGLVDADQLGRMSRDEVLALIFRPGFSTAANVSDISGRGVGMDAVQAAVARLGGRVAVESQVGQGTRIRLWLPLTLAVTHVLTISAAQQSFGVPLDVIVETVRVPHAAVRWIQRQPAVMLRQRLIPLYPLSTLLGLTPPDGWSLPPEVAVLVVQGKHGLAGLVVDGFHDTVDLIVKPLTGVLGGLATYHGTAVLGDGTVLLVLNPQELV